MRPRETKYPSPFLQQVAIDVESAIYNSIYIEKMAGLRGGICERCDKVFLAKTDKPKRFCGERCAASKRQADWRTALKEKHAEVKDGKA